MSEEIDEFSDTFDRLMKEAVDEAKGVAPAEPAAEPTTEASKSEAPATDEPKVEEPATEEPKVEEPATEEPKVETPKVEEPKVSDEDLLRRFAEIARQTPQPQKEAPKQEVQPEPELFTAEDKTFLTDYEKDWPDVVRGEALKRKAEYHQLVSYVFKEVADQLRPLMSTVNTLADRTQLNDLQSRVTDYNDVRDKVVEWVGKQPAYLQPAYNHVIKEGTVEEVEDLIARYRRDVVPAAPKQAATTPKPAALSDATKQAAAALAPVQTKRSGVVQVSDPQDFDAAWAEFVKLG